MIVVVHYGQFLNLVLEQNLRCAVEIGLLVMRHDEVFAGHHLVYQCFVIAVESEVSVGYDTHELAFVVDHWYATDVILCHHGERIAHVLASLNGHGVVYHAVLGTLHDAHLPCLLFNRHVLVYHADAAFACYGDGHRSFRHCVHRGCNERDVQCDVTCKLGGQFHRFRKDL